MADYILATDWEKVKSDDFYLSDDYLEVNKTNNNKFEKDLKNMVKNDNLFIGYIVPAVNYAIYKTMDAQQVFHNEDRVVILHCESAIINSDMKEVWKYEY